MDITLTVAEATRKTTKGGKPYLNVKTEKGKYLNAWSETEYFWHLFVSGAKLQVSITENGNLTTIVSVAGVQPPNQSGGVTVARWPEVSLQGQNQPLTATGQTAWDKLWLRLDKIEKCVDFLVEQQDALNNLKAMENMLKLEDLPVHDLEDKNPLE